MAKKAGQIERRKGYMYYVMGSGAVMETKMKRKGKGKKKKAKAKAKKKSQ